MRKPDDHPGSDRAPRAAATAKARMVQDGTIAQSGSCQAPDARNGPEAMLSQMQDDPGAALVKKHVEDNLRRVYDRALPEGAEDRFAALLTRLAKKQAGGTPRM